MLRLLALVLILSNVGYFVWTQGLLAPYGFAPATQSEPQRLKQQIRPEALRLLTLPEAGTPQRSEPGASAATPSSSSALVPIAAQVASPVECLQAGLFNDAQTNLLRTRLQSTLPPGSWALESSTEPARWMVYMGKYSSPEAVTKKKGELRYLHVAFEALNYPELEPGLSLGLYATQAEAEAAMAEIVKHGVRTAKVIQAQPELRGQKLKLPAVDATLRTLLATLKPQLSGKALKTCL